MPQPEPITAQTLVRQTIDQIDPKDHMSYPCECGNNDFYLIIRQKQIPATHPANRLGRRITLWIEILKCTECKAMYMKESFTKVEPESKLIIASGMEEKK
jgi:hypothetical protein